MQNIINKEQHNAKIEVASVLDKTNQQSASEQAALLEKRGNPDSQYAHGEKYEFGDGVSQDYVKAAMWYKRAANQGHAQAKEKMKLPWFNGELTPMKSMPSLTTFNGIGFKLYGNSDYDADSESFMTTHYLVFLFIPLLPIARYRVISDDNYSYRFLGKGSLRGIDKLHAAIFVGAFLLFLFGLRRHR